jgi:hypothetical protein
MDELTYPIFFSRPEPPERHWPLTLLQAGASRWPEALSGGNFIYGQRRLQNRRTVATSKTTRNSRSPIEFVSGWQQTKATACPELGSESTHPTSSHRLQRMCAVRSLQFRQLAHHQGHATRSTPWARLGEFGETIEECGNAGVVKVKRHHRCLQRRGRFNVVDVGAIGRLPPIATSAVAICNAPLRVRHEKARRFPECSPREDCFRSSSA